MLKMIIVFLLSFALSYSFVEWFKPLPAVDKVKFLKTTLYVVGISVVVIVLLSVFVFLF